MTIEARLEETNKLLGLILGVLTPKDVVPASPPPATPAPAVAKAPAPAKVKAATPKPAPTPSPVVETAPVASFDDFESPEAGEPEVKKLVVDDARKALVALQKAKGSPEASRGILSSNGLPSLASLKDENQELIAKIISDCAAKLVA